MPSRETIVQAGVGVLALAVFFAVPRIFGISDPTISVVASVLLNALIFGGAHLVLAILGEGNEDYPVTARWRTVGLVAALAVLALVAYGLSTATSLPQQWIHGGAVTGAVVVIVSFWYLEARDGYRDSKSGQGTI